jgi:NAD(P)-dependent dehydrogenase (short-subunit alcohol dehydrogenase family)
LPPESEAPAVPRWAVVTGGAQGIGRAVVHALAASGWRVLAVDRDEEALAELPPAVVRVQADVSDPDCPGLLRRTLEPLTTSLDLLVNNAGIMAATPPRTADRTTFERVLQVNLVAPYALSTGLLPLLKRGRHPAIVNMASTRALMSEPDTEAYAASKGGLVALTHALAVSLGPRIRVNVVSPGWIHTEGWRKRGAAPLPPLRPEDHAQHPAGRVGRPDDIARAFWPTPPTTLSRERISSLTAA